MTLNRRALLTGLTASLAIAWSCGQETDDASLTATGSSDRAFWPGQQRGSRRPTLCGVTRATVAPGGGGRQSAGRGRRCRDPGVRHRARSARAALRTHGEITVNPLLHAQIPFDPLQDVVPIASAVRPSIGIAVGPMVRARSLGELIAEARLDPGKWLWAATPGLPELVFRALLKMEQLDLQHVAYGETVAGDP